MIFINFKAYKEAFSRKALELAKIAENVAEKSGIYIAVAVNYLDLPLVAKSVNIDVFAQHIDPVDFGSFTGAVNAEMIKEYGGRGSLVNHSERRMKLADIDFCVSKLRSLGMKSIVCTNNVSTTAAVAALKPDFVAVEPPELIGSGIAVSKAKPEVVENAVASAKNICKEVKVLCGAGITNHEDYVRALDLGADGVLLASGIVKARDQKKALEELAGLI
ncbi:MAG: triose-phosphate isomerase [Archaeoglobi archaeon]|nr:MAG: triose-phosphate isomerase [Archaeoglobi archaeon]TDA28918.1 MAG: triose-phosphate isomerase [Archaeoglobi archaeon]TDA30673.1 MAG: triose-phosphate isomerase [Archaeoglobi archaeon]